MQMLRKKMARKVMGAAVVSACVGLAAPLAQASHIPGFGFSPGSYTVDPSAVGEANGPFSAKYINFNYQGENDVVGNGMGGMAGAGTFTETGIGSFSAFSTGLNSGLINAGVSGLNLNYQMYFFFDATGGIANNAAGGIDGTFSTFNISFFVDPDGDTRFNNVTPGIAGGDESRTVTGGSLDDINVLNGELTVGGFHVFSGLAAGDFHVNFLVTDCGNALSPITPLFNAGFFCGTGGLVAGVSIGDANGVNTTVVAAPPITGAGDSRTDIVIEDQEILPFKPFLSRPLYCCWALDWLAWGLVHLGANK